MKKHLKVVLLLICAILAAFVCSGIPFPYGQQDMGTPGRAPFEGDASGTNERTAAGITEPEADTSGYNTPDEGTSGNSQQNASSPEGSTGPDDGTGEAADSIRSIMYRMSLEEKIGQLFIVGFKGETAGGEITAMIRQYHVGGVILFRNNIDSPNQMLALMNSLKDLNSGNKAPLFLSVDEEGGRISRMPEQLHKLPSSQEIGKRNDPELSFAIGEILAHELGAFGFNMNFAPVLDIFSNPKNTVIGDRAFGTEPDIVSKLGVQTMTGLRTGGVIPVIKHFPGHGDTLVDSHKGLPIVEYGTDRLKSFEWEPFRTAINNHAEAIMIAHILMSKIDPDDPATLSGAVIQDVLRNQMNFSGVVVTDDMTMAAITENYKIGDAVVKSFHAGSDILLVCHGYENQRNAIYSIREAVKSGKISEERLSESVSRIVGLKMKYQLADKKIPEVDVQKINKEIEDTLSR